MRDAALAVTAATRELRQAGQDTPGSLDDRMREIARKIADNTKKEATQRLKDEYEQDKSAVQLVDATGQSEQTRRQRIYLFVSRSLKRTALEETFRTISGTSVTAVFRGIPSGSHIGGASAEIYRLIRGAEIKPIPNIILNPERWRTFNVQVTPTMVMAEGDRIIARVSGLTNPRWLREQVRHGHTGDLGVRGPITEPSEPDLITVMQKRASQLDFAQIRKNAKDAFWRKVPMSDLPPATFDQSHRVDLRMRVARDITAPDGTVIARKGDIVNPLDRRAFTLRLLVFDATRPEQVTFASSQVERWPDTLLLVSRFDRDAGWDGYRSLQSRLGKSVFRLTNDVRRRFKVRATPAVIHADETGGVVMDVHALEYNNKSEETDGD